ncbi:MAG TPA: hypothetical protein VH637_03800 [Streptosporangiaceae bacterium]
MNALQAAALIAAVFFAIGVCAGILVLIRLWLLLGTAGQLLSQYRERAGALIDTAQAAVDASTEQLARAGEITANLDQVSANMAELSTQVSALSGMARGISAGLGTPLARLAALAYGIRRAVAIRRGSGLPAPAGPGRTTLASSRPALAGRRDRAGR